MKRKTSSLRTPSQCPSEMDRAAEQNPIKPQACRILPSALVRRTEVEQNQMEPLSPQKSDSQWQQRGWVSASDLGQLPGRGGGSAGAAGGVCGGVWGGSGGDPSRREPPGLRRQQLQVPPTESQQTRSRGVFSFAASLPHFWLFQKERPQLLPGQPV